MAGAKRRFTWAEPGDWLASPADPSVLVRWPGKRRKLVFTEAGGLHRVNGRLLVVDVTSHRGPELMRRIRGLDARGCVLWRVKAPPSAKRIAAMAALPVSCLLVTHSAERKLDADLGVRVLKALKPLASRLLGLSIAVPVDRLRALWPFNRLQHLRLLSFRPRSRQFSVQAGEFVRVTLGGVARLKSLRSLVLDSLCDGMNIELRTFPSLPRLRRLKSDCSIGPLLNMGRRLPHLRVLIGDPFGLPKNLRTGRVPRLREFRQPPSQVDSAEIRALAKLNHLVVLDLRASKFLDSAAPLASLAHLRVLLLDRTTDPNEIGTPLEIPGLGRWLAGARALENLSLRHVKLQRTAVQALGNLRQLRFLDLWDTGLQDVSGAKLGSLKYVEVLELGRTKVGDVSIGQISGLPKLRVLGLAGTAGSALGLQQMLTGLARSRLEVLDLAETKIDDAAMEALSRLAHLRKLDLSHTRVGDRGVARLGRLSQLRWLQLQRCRITDASLRGLARLAHLERLNLELTGVTARGVVALARLPNLRWLNVADTPVSGGSVQWLHPRLEYLDLGLTDFRSVDLQRLTELRTLKWLRLSGTAIRGRISSLMRLPKLATLDLSATRTTNKMALTLCRLSHLRKLYLTNTLVDAGIVEKLLRCLPLEKLSISGPNISLGDMRKLFEKYGTLLYD